MGNDIRKIWTNTKFGGIESRQEKIEGMKIMTESSFLFSCLDGMKWGESNLIYLKRVQKNFLGKRSADPHLKLLPLTFNQG